MNKKLYWGLAALIMIIGVGAFVFYSQYSELQQLKQETAEADKLLEEKNKPIADNEPPVAREGFKMVKHDDHFHEVPIDAPDTWQEQPMPVVADAEVTPENVIIENDFDSLSDEEKVQRQKALNQMIMDRISDRADWKEVYQIMTENEYPYSPEVEVQLQNAYMRMEQRGALQDAKDKERRAKLAKEVEELITDVRITKY